MHARHSHVRPHRRAFLKSTGALLALPALESLGQSTGGPAKPRFAFLYVPFGVALKEWFPVDVGRDYTMTPTLEPLAGLRPEFSVVSGLTHPGVTGDHDSLDSFLTGYPFGIPSQSIDQVIAAQIGSRSYRKSLAMSSSGGCGKRGVSKTLSFNAAGVPIPADSSPRAIFDKLFPPSAEAPRAALAERLAMEQSVLDMVSDDTRALKGRIGDADRRTLDEYLDSIRDVERGLQNQERLLNTALDPQEERELQLQANPSDNPEQRRTYVRTMYDLIYLGFRANMTSVATYCLGDEGSGAFSSWPEFNQPALRDGSWHGFAHEATDRGNPVPQAKVDKWMVEQLAYLLQRLKDAKEGERSLLDSCMVLYGSGQSITHRHINLPLVLAGGSAFGLRHGQHVRYGDKEKMFASLFLTMIRQAGLELPSFAGATETLPELV